jgi:uncharacterized protein YukE
MRVNLRIIVAAATAPSSAVRSSGWQTSSKATTDNARQLWAGKGTEAFDAEYKRPNDATSQS